MIVGCYTLDLYCDCEVEHPYKAFPQTFIAETGSRCRKAARKAGWRLNLEEGTAACPQCNRGWSVEPPNEIVIRAIPREQP